MCRYSLWSESEDKQLEHCIVDTVPFSEIVQILKPRSKFAVACRLLKNKNFTQKILQNKYGITNNMFVWSNDTNNLNTYKTEILSVLECFEIQKMK